MKKDDQIEKLKKEIAEWEDTWLQICQQVGKLEDIMDDDDTWENADLQDFWEFDPWHALRRSLQIMTTMGSIDPQTFDFFIQPCEAHSGENTPPFGVFVEQYYGQCVICLVDQISSLKAENTRLAVDAHQQVWRDMIDDRPVHNQQVLFVFNGQTMQGVYSEQAMRFYTHGTQMLQARFWMPLPVMETAVTEEASA